MDVPRDLAPYLRLIKLASVPTKEEFIQISKIAGIGIIVVGSVGFIIFGIMKLIPK
jgi:protein transport protein SEC61 subunit gamma-like protein|tara:strand:+ start:463 stop:630 length:168 start_codon:yes stop_codon:yes gene_type:complete